jgi:hypothetical protein
MLETTPLGTTLPTLAITYRRFLHGPYRLELSLFGISLLTLILWLVLHQLEGGKYKPLM